VSVIKYNVSLVQEVIDSSVQTQQICPEQVVEDSDQLQCVSSARSH